ncbi:MAG TPA: hypothetical protein DCM05_00675 [Elusimicrobia bacterium]|nr:hypothetical protein [Elusimicrobiota bacterium]
MSPKALLLVAAAALLIRLGYLLSGPGSPVVGDSLGYHSYAVHLLDSGTYVNDEGERASRPPGYPVFLAGVYAVLGRAPAAVVAVQAALGAAACLLVALIAASVLAPPWPLLCGLAAAAYYGLFAPPAFLLAECLFSSLLALSFLALHRKRAFLFGLALAAVFLVRPEVLLFAGLAILVLPFLPGGGGRKGAAAAALGFVLLTAPWVVRNYAVFHRLVPSSSRGGISLYAGLQMPLERSGVPVEAFHMPAEGLSELEQDADYSRAFRALWGSLGWGLRLRAYAFNLLSHLYPFLPGYDLTFMLLLPLWLYGLWLARSRGELRAAALFVLLSIVLYTVFGGPASRYRQGYAPLLVVLAGAGAAELWTRGKTARLGLAGWGGLNLLVWLFSDSLRTAALAAKRAFFP